MEDEQFQHTITKANIDDLHLHGPNTLGVGYADSRSASNIYAAMCDVVRPASQPISILDVGCGLGDLYPFIQRTIDVPVQYLGVDLGQEYVDHARSRFPDGTFQRADVLDSSSDLGQFDYIVACGLFNWRGDISIEDMSSYWKEMVLTLLGCVVRALPSI